MTVPLALWLQPADVKAYLRITDTADDDLVARACAAVEPFVQRCRPDMLVTSGEPPVTAFTPDGEVYQAGVALAARLYRRRNSPGGIEAMTDNALYVARFDPDIERALRRGYYAIPGVG